MIKPSHKFDKCIVLFIGGLYKSIHEAVAINAKSFAMFLRSAQRWASKPLADDVVEKFKKTLKVGCTYMDIITVARTINST